MGKKHDRKKHGKPEKESHSRAGAPKSKKSAKRPKSKAPAHLTGADAFLVGPDTVLAQIDPNQVRFGPRNRAEAQAATAAMLEEATMLHEKLWAESRAGGNKSLLICIQGMDTSGKGGASKALDLLLDPLGFSVTGFGPPTAEERSHPYLWRHEQALPKPGTIRVWDRSHYEEVLVVRVHSLVPRATKRTWTTRFNQINKWEAGLSTKGVRVVKVMLHISKDEQKQRLLDRLQDPTKFWKYNPGDIDERNRWDEYQAAYQDALTACSTDLAPWYVVPANHKWYRNWALSVILLETLRDMDLEYPEADFDVAAELDRVNNS